MTRQFPVSTQPRSLTSVNSLLASTVCHLAALLALAIMVSAGDSKSTGIELAAGLADGADLPADEDEWVRDVVSVADDEAAAFGPAQLFVAPTPAVGDVGASDALVELAENDSGAEGNFLTQAAAEGDVARTAGKAATEFFGIGGYGQTFVYVVDCSGSMSENGKFQRAVYELLQSVEQLRREQRYFILFYNSGTYPMDAPGPVEATDDEFERTRQWVALARPDGGTYPLPALLAALSMKPAAIYFLSDGIFDSRTALVVRRHNRRGTGRIPIHSIAFADRESEALMRRIARESGGQYRFVP